VLIPFVPQYLTFDPAKQQAPINPNAPGLDDGLITAHALFGTVAIVTMCLAVWPWLRARYPAVHRWSGRLYVFLGALPSSLLIVGVNYLHNGWHGDIGAYAEAVVWFGTTLTGQLAPPGRSPPTPPLDAVQLRHGHQRHLGPVGIAGPAGQSRIRLRDRTDALGRLAAQPARHRMVAGPRRSAPLVDPDGPKMEPATDNIGR
jgi:hypothetical protein